MQLRWTVGTKVGAAFVLTVIIFVVVGAVSYRSTNELVEASELRRRTFEVLSGLDAVLVAVQDVQIAQRAYTVSGDAADLQPYREALSTINGNLQGLRAMIEGTPEDQRRLDALAEAIQTYLGAVARTIETVRAEGPEAANTEAARTRRTALRASIRTAIDGIKADKTALLKERIDEAAISATRTRWTILVGTLAALIVAALAGSALTRNIAGPLGDLTVSAGRISAGDLNVPMIAFARRDEVGVLSAAFVRMTQSLRSMATAAEQISAGDLRTTVTPLSPNDVLGHAFARMVTNLRDQLGQLVEGANVLGAAASQIVASTTQLASSASQTATAVSETTTTVEEVRQTAQLASQKAKYVADTAQKAVLVSQSGRKSAEDVSDGMGRIRNQMDAIAASTTQLSEQTQAIGQIIATVEDLATQSNVLAVNAAIEAAKAGEHGKGFAVVAQEVKSLAEQSRQATAQVRGILGDIQKATTSAVLATEQGSKAVEAGARQTQVAAEAIQVLSNSVGESAQAATQIAASSQQQLVGVDQVASAMDSIKQASSQNVASARQLETAARNLSDLGGRLKHIVAKYQL